MPNNQNIKNVSESDTKVTETTAAEINAPENNAKTNTLHKGVTSFVYAGPTLPGGKLKGNAVLCGTYAEIMNYCEDAISEYPSVRRLIIPVATLATAREKTQTSGNAMYENYNRIVAEIKEKTKARLSSMFRIFS